LFLRELGISLKEVEGEVEGGGGGREKKKEKVNTRLRISFLIGRNRLGDHSPSLLLGRFQGHLDSQITLVGNPFLVFPFHFFLESGVGGGTEPAPV